MLVTDLHHFLDLPPDTPGPARRLAEHLSNIVAAATAGDAGTTWESALPCRRRPANRRCPGRMIVVCTQPETPIGGSAASAATKASSATGQNRPSICAANGWPWPNPVHEIVIDAETAATLRDVAISRHRLPESSIRDTRIRQPRLHLAVTDADLDELIGAVAAEANHEPNRRRQQRLDAAFEALNTATDTNGW